MSVPITSFKRKKHYDFVYDDLAFEKLMRYYGFEKLMRYYGFEKEEELLEFLKTQGIQY